jgi:HAD superfamily hydrolase (TIGR01509 family)
VIEAVVFDFDGLLVETEWPGFEAWQTVFAEHGAELELEEFLVCIGTRYAIDWGDLLAAKTGRPGPTDAELRRRKEPLLDASITDLPLLPGVIEWLQEIGRRGLRCAIASSSERSWIDPHLDRLGVAHHFEAISSWDGPECGFPPKPAPDLYTRACAALGVEPAAALAVEDSANGVRAAKAAGMRCVAVPNRVTESSDFSPADLVIPSLATTPLADALAQLDGDHS